MEEAERGGLNSTVWMFCESDFSNEGVTEAMNESACLCAALFYNLTPSAFTGFAQEVVTLSDHKTDNVHRKGPQKSSPLLD